MWMNLDHFCENCGFYIIYVGEPDLLSAELLPLVAGLLILSVSKERTAFIFKVRRNPWPLTTR